MLSGDEFYGDEITSGPADPCPMCGMPGTAGNLCETCDAWETCGAEKYDRDEPVDLVDFVNRNLRKAMWGTP